ncbi:MAG TPA: hypothetical protein VLK65_32685 [Vicinamibacteria bacterium]|nr:hypothetical protein [Vicinamibacteria bacterium]
MRTYAVPARGTLPAPQQIEIEWLSEPPILTTEMQRMMSYLESNSHRTPPVPDAPVARLHPTSAPQDSPAAVPLTHLPNDTRDFVYEFYQGPGGFNSQVGEPSIGANGGVFFITNNWYAAVSANYGKDWSFVNPFVVGNADAGFCCDQKAIYVPQFDLMIWILQTIENGTQNRYRMVVFRRLSDLTTATYHFYDITPAIFGLNATAPNKWLDFPDIQFTNNRLYLTANVFTVTANTFADALVASFDLNQMAAADQVNFSYGTIFNGPGAGRIGTASNRLTSGADDSTMHIFGHLTTSSVRIYTWTDADVLTSVDRSLGTTWADPTTCPGIGGDPCGRLDARPTAAFRANGGKEIVMGWSSGPIAPFPNVHMKFARFTTASPNNLVTVNEIWGNTFHYYYGSGGTNGRGHGGGTVQRHSASNHPECGFWMMDDVSGHVPGVGLVITASDWTPNISGDYLESRPYYPHDDVWAGTCINYFGGFSVDYSAVIFGRTRDMPPFVRGDVSDNQAPPLPRLLPSDVNIDPERARASERARVTEQNR